VFLVTYKSKYYLFVFTQLFIIDLAGVFGHVKKVNLYFQLSFNKKISIIAQNLLLNDLITNMPLFY